MGGRTVDLWPVLWRHSVSLWSMQSTAILNLTYCTARYIWGSTLLTDSFCFWLLFTCGSGSQDCTCPKHSSPFPKKSAHQMALSAYGFVTSWLGFVSICLSWIHAIVPCYVEWQHLCQVGDSGERCTYSCTLLLRKASPQFSFLINSSDLLRPFIEVVECASVM